MNTVEKLIKTKDVQEATLTQKDVDHLISMDLFLRDFLSEDDSLSAQPSSLRVPARRTLPSRPTKTGGATHNDQPKDAPIDNDESRNPDQGQVLESKVPSRRALPSRSTKTLGSNSKHLPVRGSGPDDDYHPEDTTSEDEDLYSDTSGHGEDSEFEAKSS
ncbi:hypothetical protein CEP54_005787 [Fusarium duplospermum]|uniref:Uncharacterized protein n=1 Tax=Fusarium duplospermum TaxID=1325734 RepID=A0A428QAP0_9HYPO|nr:hypothetical protein CEP54_005787 [Fusarium duplospermum]